MSHIARKKNEVWVYYGLNYWRLSDKKGGLEWCWRYRYRVGQIFQIKEKEESSSTKIKMRILSFSFENLY